MNFHLKRILWNLAPKMVREGYDLLCRVRATHKARCPICSFDGYFRNYGSPPRLNALCPKCNSLERHRLFFLNFISDDTPFRRYIKEPIIHFAAEPLLEKHLRLKHKEGYTTADLYIEADLRLNIEHIDLPSNSVETVICMHVMEHVDDGKALSEIFRVMKDKSILILAFPIIESWEKTYENPKIQSKKDKIIHFGQMDHNKYYGRDVRERITSHGFKLIYEIIATPELCIEFNLMRGETLFLCEKNEQKILRGEGP